jgi:hypothetical protein
MELRFTIWKEFHSTYDESYAGRVVTLCRNTETGFYSKTSLPPTFFINRECYIEALRSFTPAFASCITTQSDLALYKLPNRTSIYVNFSKDIIFLQAIEGNNIRSMFQVMSKDDRKMI